MSRLYKDVFPVAEKGFFVMTNMTSSISGEAVQQQTPENTTAPFETVQTSVPPSPAPKKSTGFTKEMRDAKIAAGWIPPEKRVKEVDLTQIVKQTQDSIEQNEAIRLLDNLVAKMVAMENNAQYQSMWLAFFQHGGVYNGPNYEQELREAANFLNARKLVVE